MAPDLESKLMQALGKATVARWGELPQAVQQVLFEGAAPIKVDDFREALAVYLHEHHPRTAH